MSLFLFFLALGLALMVLQYKSANDTLQIATQAIQQAAVVDKYDLGSEKVRQELINQRIANDSKANMPTNLAAGLGALSAVLISLGGAILAIFGYLNEREKDRKHSLALEKDRQDRLAAMLSDTLTRLVSIEPRQRVVGAAGLMPFFAEDLVDFHLQALAALIAAARIDGDPPEVRQSVRVAVEKAVHSIDHDVLTQISWQGVHLPSINLNDQDLRSLDLRDAKLEKATFNRAKLDGADLQATDLRGAQLQKATLIGADLKYADLAGASLVGAALCDAQIDGIKILKLDLEGTDFKGVKSGWHDAPWHLAANWRKAVFDDAVREALEARLSHHH